jgi:hypothetical protein
MFNYLKQIETWKHMFDIIPEININIIDDEYEGYIINTCFIINNKNIDVCKCFKSMIYPIKPNYNKKYDIKIFHIIDNDSSITIIDFKIIRDIHRKLVTMFGIDYIKIYDTIKNNQQFINIMQNANNIDCNYDMIYEIRKGFIYDNKQMSHDEYINEMCNLHE